jgi:hypothetical protein
MGQARLGKAMATQTIAGIASIKKERFCDG